MNLKWPAIVGCFLASFWPVALATASQLLVPLTVDPGMSTLTLTVCVQGVCDADTEPLTGSVLLALDCAWPTESAALRNFHFRGATNFDFTLFFGGLVGSVTNLEISDAQSEPERPFEPVAAGNVTFKNVPIVLGGLVNYEASGFVCAALQNSGLSCVDTIDLTGRAPNVLGEFPVRLELSGNTLHFSGSFRFQRIPLIETNPEIGTISGMGTINASGIIQPCLSIRPGDLSDETAVTWSKVFSNFRLFQTESLVPPVHWEPVDPIFIVDDGNTVTAHLPSEGRSRFYRLASE